MAANPIPEFLVVNYKAAGARAVYPLSNGITLGTQDGSDLGTGDALVPGLEASTSPNVNDPCRNRIIEAFGKRFCLHGQRVYERDQGGSGQWGRVDGGTGSATDRDHSGLHLLHPAGVPTLAFLWANANVLWATKTTDGLNWTEVNTGLDMQAVANLGGSVVLGTSIFWLRAGISPDNREIRSYDFELGVAAEYDIPNWSTNTLTALHAHQGALFLWGSESTAADKNLWRLDGLSFTIVNTTVTGVVAGSTDCLWSDGYDIFAIWGTGSLFNARRFQSVLFGETLSYQNATAVVQGVVLPFSNPSGFYPVVATHPSPLPQDKRVYFWHRPGNTNTGTFNLWRFNYRVITTGVHTGAFTVGKYVRGGTSGHRGIITDVVVDTSLSLTYVTGTLTIGVPAFQAAESLIEEEADGTPTGASATSTSALLDVAATSLGTGISNNFGIPQEGQGELARIPTKGAARPSFAGAPLQRPFDVRRHPIRIYGTGGDVDIKLYYSPISGTPDKEGTLDDISFADATVTDGLVGNLGEVALEALTPSAGDAYVVSAVDGDGTLNPGSVSISVGDIVEYDGANWTLAHDATAGFPDFGAQATLSTATALIAPYADGVDDGLRAAFDGTSLTGIVVSTPAIVSNEVRNLTPANGAVLYYLDHDHGADLLAPGQVFTKAMDIV